MPYARRYVKARTYGNASRAAAKLRASSTARNQSVAAKRRTNKPIARIQRKAYVPQKVKNSASIAVLAKQINRLQRTQLGSYQRKYEFFTKAFTATEFQDSRPICFSLNNFGAPNPCDVYGFDGAQLITHGSFATASMGLINSGGPYNMWEDAQSDKVSDTQFLPIRNTLTMEFVTSMTTAQEAVWIRIDMVKPNMVLRTTSEHHFNLPDSISAFGMLASPNLQYRQYINSRYFTKVQKTRYVKLEMTKDTLGNTATVRRMISIPVTFPNKVLKPDAADHASSGETFLTNIPTQDQMFMIISTSYGPTQAVSFSVRRKLEWRDPSGVFT